MADAFDAQARRYHVNPIHNLSDTAGESAQKAAQDFSRRGGRWHYAGPISGLASMIAPPVNTRGFTMTAKLNLAETDVTAPIFSMGGQMGGIGFYLKDGKPTLVMNDLGGRSASVAAAQALAPGVQTIALDVIRSKPDASGATLFEVTLRSGDKVLAQEKLTFALPFYFGIPLSTSRGLGIAGHSGLSCRHAISRLAHRCDVRLQRQGWRCTANPLMSAIAGLAAIRWQM